MTSFVGISPALASGDDFVHASPLLTNMGTAVTFVRDAGDVITGFTGTFTGHEKERFLIKIFDASTGDWHVQSGADGIWVFVQTGKFVPFASLGTQIEAGGRARARPMFAEVDGRLVPVNTAQEAREIIGKFRKEPPPPPPPPKPPKLQYKILKAG